MNRGESPTTSPVCHAERLGRSVRRGGFLLGGDPRSVGYLPLRISAQKGSTEAASDPRRTRCSWRYPCRQRATSRIRFLVNRRLGRFCAFRSEQGATVARCMNLASTTTAPSARLLSMRNGQVTGTVSTVPVALA